ncbi:MAG: 50S ribosomal protein L22 [Ignavibacteriae bacterium]|nr:50S ribosomal protein L22 [Ignavibacteriota bacterium]
MEARAINRYVSSSPRKMRLVIDLIRGKSVPEAINILHFSPKHAAKVAEKTLRSAVSNLQNKDEAGRTDVDTLYIKEAYVDGGPSLKRIVPAPMGRAYRMLKRSNHLTIVVVQKTEQPKKSSTVKEQPSARKETKTKE